MFNRKRVVITGVGPIASCGIGRDNFWQGILLKDTNIVQEEYELDGQVWEKFHLHKLRGFNINKFGLDQDKLDDILAWKEGEEIADLNYLIAAVKLALDDSGLDYRKENNDLGLVLGHENIGLMPFGFKVSNLAYELLIDKKKSDLSKKDFFDKFYRKFLKSGYDVQSFANLFHVARVFNIHNYSLFINNACASGLFAFEAAAQAIKNNQAKAVVVAAADHPEIYKYLWFRELGIYSPEGKIKPFCKDSSGLVFGDGGAGVVLEDFEHALKRKAKIYAEYAGGGFDLEGWKITVPQIGNDSYRKAMEKAFKQSRIKEKDIDVVVPHGVGSQPIDYYESKAITDTFGKNSKKPLITTFKPYVGHNLGSSALLESVILLLALKNNYLPETLNQDNPDPKYNISLLKKGLQIKFKAAMKICCAFAGFNSAVIFRRI